MSVILLLRSCLCRWGLTPSSCSEGYVGTIGPVGRVSITVTLWCGAVQRACAFTESSRLPAVQMGRILSSVHIGST